MDDDETERRNNIIAEARETLARIAHVEVEHRSYDDPLTQWAANMPKKPEPAPQPQRRTTDAEALRWQTYIDGRIDAVLAEHKMLADARQEAVGKALGEIRKQLRDEIREQLGLLRADLTIEKAAEHRERGDVIELPSFIERRRHDAA